MAFNFCDWDKNPELIGVFRGAYKSVGSFQKPVFLFVREDGTNIHTWGFLKLKNDLYGVPFGSKLKITYLGMEKMPDSPRFFKNFKIDVLSAPDKKDEGIPQSGYKKPGIKKFKGESGQ